MLQASPQKIDIQSLADHLPFQFRHPAFLGPRFAIAREPLGP
jgi:hypothetical protein